MKRKAIQVHPIRSKADYDAALKRIESLMGAKLGTPEGDELDVLATLVDAYEEKHFPMDAPDPVTAIQFRMTLAMVRRVRAGLGISADLLVGTGKVRRRA